MKIKLYLLSTMFIISACLSDSGEKLPEPKPVSTEEIKRVVISDYSVLVLVNCAVPEPCWTYVRTDQSINGSEINLTVIARRTTNDPCIQVMSSIDPEMQLTMPTAGSYTLKFWRHDGTTIDTTIVIQ